MTLPPDPASPALLSVVGEVEQHVSERGWDQRPVLFALVQTEQLLREEPQLARTMGLVAGDPAALTPIEQDDLGEGPLDELLGRVLFGQDVLGAVVTQEAVVVPPGAEAELEDAEDPAAVAHAHPQRREVRAVVGVARDGRSAVVLRLRGEAGAPDDVVTGPDLAPGLIEVLRQTLEP